MIKLQLRDQPQRFVSLTGGRVTVGRDASNDLTIDDASVSDFHAEVVTGPDGLEIIDLLSGAGTFVNDQMVRQRGPLRAWDVIRLGNVLLEVNDPRVNRPSDWALRSESELLAGQFFPLARATTVGRGLECDLRIDDATLSRRHGELTIRGTCLHVRDLGSSNGIYVNERRVQQADLEAGDCLRFGSRAFVVVGPRSDGPSLVGGAVTVVPDGVPAHTEVLSRPGARLVEQTDYLGPAWALPLTPPGYRLGRDADNDVVIADTSISRAHALLAPSGAGWQVQDMNSSNGVLVNGRRVESAVLTDGDEIRLGRAAFVYRSG